MEKRYFDLKGDTTRVETNVQDTDRTLIVTGPIAVDAGDANTLYALEQSPGIKEISVKEYAAATDYSKLTVEALDARFGHEDGYPAKGSKAAKVAFATKTTPEEDN